MSMRITKNDRARVIVLALYPSLKELPAADHWHVKKLERRKSEHLKSLHKTALLIISERMEAR